MDQTRNLLLRFNGDVHLKEALLGFIDDVIAEEALNRMYEKKDVSHIADAHTLIRLAFQKLNVEFGPKQQEKAITNEAR